MQSTIFVIFDERKECDFSGKRVCQPRRRLLRAEGYDLFPYFVSAIECSLVRVPSALQVSVEGQAERWGKSRGLRTEVSLVDYLGKHHILCHARPFCIRRHPHQSSPRTYHRRARLLGEEASPAPRRFRSTLYFPPTARRDGRYSTYSELRDSI